MKMTTEFKRTSGICLLIGVILAAATMVLHPTGGDINHIVKIRSVLVFSHSVALICLPFIGFGTWGLSNILQTKNGLSTLAFIIFSFGLIAAMVAAAINGLTLPYFASKYAATGNDLSLINAVIGYGHAVNISMTYIFIAATSFAIGIWSILIIKTNQIPKWLGYFGLIILAFGSLGVILNFNFTNLFGFRLFVFGLVSWKIVVGINMLLKSESEKQTEPVST